MESSVKNPTDNENDNKMGGSHEKFNLKGDYGNIAILLLLYILQGDRREIFKTNEILAP